MSARLVMLPVEKINKQLPLTGPIYDIGCGGGDLADELALYSLKRTVIGIDANKRKIENARKKYQRSNLAFHAGNVLTYSYQTFKGALMSDFLHHISYPEQERLLTQLTRKIKRGGKLIIKEIDRGDGVRMMLSRLWDFLLYPQDSIYYRRKKEWIRLLSSFGFKVEVSNEIFWFPGSTTLFVCTKKW